MAASRCVPTICSAPPSARSVVSRRTREPARRSSSQSRVMTSWRYGASIRRRRARPAPPGAGRAARTCRLDLVQHRVDERRLDLDPRRAPPEPVPLLDRALDRLARAVAVEMLDPQEVVEQTRHARSKRSSFASASSRIESRTLRRSDRASQRAASSSSNERLARVALVVEEVLLELVEDDQQRAVEPPAPGGEDVRRGTCRQGHAPSRARARSTAPRWLRSPATRVVAAHELNDTPRTPAPRCTSSPARCLAAGARTTPARSRELLPTPLAP